MNCSVLFQLQLQFIFTQFLICAYMKEIMIPEAKHSLQTQIKLCLTHYLNM